MKKGKNHGVILCTIAIVLEVLLPISMVFIPLSGIGGQIIMASVAGDAQDDHFGWNVSSAGDFNRDGYYDFVVGAPGYDSNRGRAYVFLGGPWLNMSFSAASANITINGSAQGDRFGWDVSDAGDFNKDGFGDIVIGAPGNDSDSGCAYIFLGNTTHSQYLEADSADITIKGNLVGDLFASSVSEAGDVNKDGFDDIIIGAHGSNGETGSAHVFQGSAAIPPLITVIDSNLTVFGENPLDRFGHSVSGAGDVNNDGFDDVIVGAPGADKSYVYFGGDPMNAWVQSTQGDFDLGTKVHSVTDMAGDGELKLDDFYNIKAMMAYNGSGSNIPRIRTWNQTEWGPWTDSAAPDPDANYWFDIESGTVRKNEKILGVQDEAFDLNLQVWNGSSWGPVLELVDVAVNPDYRSFDIAYESQSGDAMVAYFNATSGDMFPKYRIWNGSSWGSELDALEVGTGAIYWIVLASNPNSDEILMVTLDWNNDIWVQVWDGEAWGNNISIETDTPDNIYQCFDAAYESESGYGFIAWADNSFDVRYRRWKGNWTEPDASWGPSPGLTRFVKLASEPNSNYLLAARLDSSSEIAARVWNGSSWGLSMVVTPSPKENTMACFDVAWESKSDKQGIIAYGIANDAPMYRIVNGTEINDTELTSLDPNPDTGDPNWIVLESDPQSNDIMMMYLVFDPFGVDDIGVELWNGSEWKYEQNVENASKRLNGRRFGLSYTDTSGYMISNSFDGKLNLSWGRIKWNADLPPGTALKIRTRTSSDNLNWSSWSNWYTPGDRITSPPNSFIQYQAHLETTNVSLTPTLYDVSIELNLPDVVINGTAGEDFGWSLSGLGDMDGDLLDDIIIGAPQNNSGQGSAYIFIGEYLTLESQGDRTIDLSNGDLANYTMVGESPGDMFGYSVSAAGYFNNDGILDVLIGAPNTNSRGSIYVFYGGPTQPPFIPASQNDFFYEGENVLDYLGWSVACAGNVDNDTAGYYEILIGAPFNDSGSNTDSGRAYVLHMFNQPELMIRGQGDGVYQSIASGVQVNMSVIEAGTNETWLIDVENDGSLNDTFIFNFTFDIPPGWSFEVKELFTQTPLNDGDIIYWPTGIFYTYVLKISSPISAVDGEETWVEITLTSQNDTTKKDSVRAIARVVDVTIPKIHDTTTGSPTTKDPFTIVTNVTDNILMGQVNLTFWFNTTSGLTTPLNVSMNDIGGNDYDFDIPVPSNAKELFYYISASDSSSNWNETGTVTLAVFDNTPPDLTDVVVLPEMQITGGRVNISLSVSDNFQISQVRINITFPGSAEISYPMIKGAGNTWLFEDIFLDNGTYTFTIWANDTNKNQNETAVFQFSIITPPPTVDYIQIRSQPNGMGVVLKNLVYDLTDYDTFYAAGYNHTHGYIGDVQVSWSSTDPSGSLNPLLGSSTNFTAAYEGGGNIFAVYALGIQNSTTFTVQFSQMPTIKGTIPSIEIIEDYGLFQMDLSDYAEHYLGLEHLSWYVTGIDDKVITVLGGFENQTGEHVFSFVTKKNMFGNMEVTYWLVYDSINKTSQKAWINITPVNDAPRIRNCPDLVVRFDLPFVFDYTTYILDIDNTLAQLALSVNNSQYITVDGFKVTYSYPAKMLGNWEFITLTVSDGDLSGSTAIKVRITSNNPPIIVAKLPDVTIYEHETEYAVFDLDDYFSDPEGDKLIFSVGPSNVDITINENNTVDFSAENGWTGSEYVAFRAKDVIGSLTEQVINIKVIPVNDPPVISEIDEIKIHYNYPYKIDLKWYIKDRDNTYEELVISTNNPGNVSVNGTVLTLLYPEIWENLNYPYTVPVTIYVSDGFYNVSQAVTIMVSDNYPPDILRPLSDISLYEDNGLFSVYDLDEYFYDLDGDPIFYTYGNKSISVTIHENHTIDLIPHPDWFGSELILIRASDDKEAFLEDTLLLTVIPVNDAPFISDIMTQEGDYETEWVLDLSEYLNDVDNELVDLVVSTNSSYAEVSGHVLIFYYPKSVKKDTVYITVNDGELNTTSSFSVKVTTPSAPAPEVPWLLLIITIVLAVLLSGALITRIARYDLEELFLITKSGMLISHQGIHTDEEKDKDILASMFVAVQSFIKDAFAEADSEVLKRMDYGEKTVLIHIGNYVLLTAFITGSESKLFLKDMKKFIDFAEEYYKGSIEQWDGNYDNLPDIDELLGSFFNGTFKKKYLKSNGSELKGNDTQEKGDAEA